MTQRLISIVVPVYNESKGLAIFHAHLLRTFETLSQTFEIIYCDDGSTDGSDIQIREWCSDDTRVKLVRLSRNFGKESALAAGIAAAKGEAIIMLDADGQHPVDRIPDFIAAWQAGAQVVIGIRTANKGEGSFKRLGSRLFYALFNKFSQQALVAGSTDFRLITRPVRAAFLELKENDRLTRGLIDWLGFERAYIRFTANARIHGKATYSRRKLIGLATNSFVSLTATPMYVFGYVGVIISIASFVLGTAILIEQLLLNDPLHWDFTGTAMLGVLIVFLVGLVLMSEGILSLYISRIHTQSKQRPLYIIDNERSEGLNKTDV